MITYLQGIVCRKVAVIFTVLLNTRIIAYGEGGIGGVRAAPLVVEPTTIKVPTDVLEMDVLGFRLWMILGFVFAGILIIVIILCCIFDCRIPRTKQEIEADHEKKEAARRLKQGLSPYPPGTGPGGHGRPHPGTRAHPSQQQSIVMVRGSGPGQRSHERSAPSAQVHSKSTNRTPHSNGTRSFEAMSRTAATLSSYR